MWTMSNHFCYDARMQELLRKISYIFVEKAKEFLELKCIFNRTATEVNLLATNCSLLLNTWKATYMATRTYIEESGVGSRWEFDKTVLFSEVEHCARIGKDVADLAKVSDFIKLYTICSMFKYYVVTDFHGI